MQKGFLKGLLVGFCLTFVLLSFFCWLMLRRENLRIAGISDDNNEVVQKINTLVNYIDKYYDGEYTTEELYDSAYKGLVDGLGDKYSEYYTEEDYKVLQEQTTGNYVGIGSYVSYSEDGFYPMISLPMKDSPAEKAGLKSGDIIVEVDGESTYEMDLDTAVSKIKGEKGTDVVLTIFREGESDYLEFIITRAPVVAQTVNYELLGDGIGYIEVTSFETPTYEQFDDAIDDMEARGMKSLIIDLRNNPGGLLYTSTSMLDRILPEGKLLVYTLDKNNKRDEIYSDDKEQLSIPIVVLLNKASASASEVFSGCLKDYGKATIVGETSFGKGIVQTLYSFGDGSRIKLTTSSYYSPDGINIHGTGIEPDIEVSDNPETEVDEQLEAAINELTK